MTMESAEASQREVVAYLADPRTHGIPVEVVETHAATVFLAGDAAFKMKKAVRFPFLDYSSLELRREAVRREISANLRNAPDIYLGVTAVTREEDGRLALDGEGEPVEWLVRMRRFDETRTLDRVVDRDGRLDDRLVERLAEMIAAAQAGAERREAEPWIADLADYVEQNDRAFRDIGIASPEILVEVHAAARDWHARIADLLAERGRMGLVRLLHGDLHAANVALVGDRPVLFDAIEFDDAIATGDILYDAGFLIMDLDERGLRREANLLLGRILVETVRRDPDPAAALDRHVAGLAALPFFLHMRAAIRAKVTAAKAANLGPEAAGRAMGEATRYFAAARRYFEPSVPVLVAVGGLSGSGKSTLARSLAPRLGRAPGALHLRSDVVRKLIAGKADAERLPPQNYTKAASDQVYAVLAGAARTALAAGHSVVVDAVAARPAERDRFRAIAEATEARFEGLWLDAPPEVLRERVGGRTGDASDADAFVVERQLGYGIGALDWTRIDASGGADSTHREALGALGLGSEAQ